MPRSIFSPSRVTPVPSGSSRRGRPGSAAGSGSDSCRRVETVAFLERRGRLSSPRRALGRPQTGSPTPHGCAGGATPGRRRPAERGASCLRARPRRRRASGRRGSVEGGVGVGQRDDLDLGATGTLGASARNSSPSARVRLATEPSVRSPQSSSYGKDGMSLMWMPAQTTAPALGAWRAAPRQQRADGREDDRGVELGSGGASSEAPAHSAPELAGERLRLGVARAGEGEDLAGPGDGDLAEDVRGGAEAVEADGARRRRPGAAPGSRSARRRAAAPPARPE